MAHQASQREFEEKLHTHRRIVFKVAAVYARSEEDRKDLAQDIALQLWRSPLDRALALLYLDDLSHAAIAAVLGISESNVGTRIARLKQRLRRDLSGASLSKGETRGTR